jgi:hypothetical protein
VGLLDSPLYDTARQMLFCLTPIFIFASRAIDGFLRRVRGRLAQAGILLAVVAPGLLGIYLLHPYEYIYYNELVGGVSGAKGRFELDYWATSYREAMDYLSSNAPHGASVAVPYSSETAAPYASNDLRLLSGSDPESTVGADFILVPVRGVLAARLYPDAPSYFAVVRDGAELAIVRDLRGTR